MKALSLRVFDQGRHAVAIQLWEFVRVIDVAQIEHSGKPVHDGDDLISDLAPGKFRRIADHGRNTDATYQ